MTNSTLLLLVAAFLETSVRAQVHESVLPLTVAESLEQAHKLNRGGEYREAIKSYEALLSGYPADQNVEFRAHVLTAIADAETELGNFAEGQSRAREALSSLAFSQMGHTGAFAIAEGALTDALRAQAKNGEARAHGEHAVAIAKDTLGPAHPEFGMLLNTLAGVAIQQGDLGRARELCRRALEIFANAGEASRGRLGTAYQNLAVVEAQRRKPKQALDAVHHALAAWNGVLPPDHPFIVYALSTEMLVYLALKELRKAEDAIPEALRRCLSRFGPDHPQRVLVLNNAAAVYVAGRKYQEAEPLLRESLAVARRCFPAGHPFLSQLLKNYSGLLARLNRREEASRLRAESNVISAEALRRTDR